MKFPEQYRFNPDNTLHLTRPGDRHGAFVVPGHKSPGRRTLHIVAIDGQDTNWDHVSVSVDNSRQCPTWEEMRFIKALFFEPTECVVQFHPPEADYVNLHPGVLHLWRYWPGFPMPPKVCV